MILTARALAVVFPCKLVFPDGTGIDYPKGFDFLVLENEDGKECLLPSGTQLEIDDDLPIMTQYPRVWVSPLAYEPKLLAYKKVTNGQATEQGRLPQNVSQAHDDRGGTEGEVPEGSNSARKPKGRGAGRKR